MAMSNKRPWWSLSTDEQRFWTKYQKVMARVTSPNEHECHSAATMARHMLNARGYSRLDTPDWILRSLKTLGNRNTLHGQRLRDLGRKRSQGSAVRRRRGQAPMVKTYSREETRFWKKFAALVNLGSSTNEHEATLALQRAEEMLVKGGYAVTDIPAHINARIERVHGSLDVLKKLNVPTRPATGGVGSTGKKVAKKVTQAEWTKRFEAHPTWKDVDFAREFGVHHSTVHQARYKFMGLQVRPPRKRT